MPKINNAKNRIRLWLIRLNSVLQIMSGWSFGVVQMGSFCSSFLFTFGHLNHQFLRLRSHKDCVNDITSIFDNIPHAEYPFSRLPVVGHPENDVRWRMASLVSLLQVAWNIFFIEIIFSTSPAQLRNSPDVTADISASNCSRLSFNFFTRLSVALRTNSGSSPPLELGQDCFPVSNGYFPWLPGGSRAIHVWDVCTDHPYWHLQLTCPSLVTGISGVGADPIGTWKVRWCAKSRGGTSRLRGILIQQTS